MLSPADRQRMSFDAATIECLIAAAELLLETAEDEISPNEAARLLGMSRQTVTNLIGRGTLPYRKVGAHHRLGRREVERYAEQQKALRRDTLDTIASILQQYDF